MNTPTFNSSWDAIRFLLGDEAGFDTKTSLRIKGTVAAAKEYLEYGLPESVKGRPTFQNISEHTLEGLEHINSGAPDALIQMIKSNTAVPETITTIIADITKRLESTKISFDNHPKAKVALEHIRNDAQHALKTLGDKSPSPITIPHQVDQEALNHGSLLNLAYSFFHQDSLQEALPQQVGQESTNAIYAIIHKNTEVLHNTMPLDLKTRQTILHLPTALDALKTAIDNMQISGLTPEIRAKQHDIGANKASSLLSQITSTMEQQANLPAGESRNTSSFSSLFYQNYTHNDFSPQTFAEGLGFWEKTVEFFVEKTLGTTAYQRQQEGEWATKIGDQMNVGGKPKEGRGGKSTPPYATRRTGDWSSD